MPSGSSVACPGLSHASRGHLHSTPCTPALSPPRGLAFRWEPPGAALFSEWCTGEGACQGCLCSNGWRRKGPPLSGVGSRPGTWGC